MHACMHACVDGWIDGCMRACMHVRSTCLYVGTNGTDDIYIYIYVYTHNINSFLESMMVIQSA